MLVKGATCTRVTLYTAGHLHTAVSHCWHNRAPIVHTAVSRKNNEHGCVCLCCRAVCKLPGCVEGHPWCTVLYYLLSDTIHFYTCHDSHHLQNFVVITSLEFGWVKWNHYQIWITIKNTVNGFQQCLNSLFKSPLPGNTYMCHWTASSLV